jgi:anti-sigma B factor antagonist
MRDPSRPTVVGGDPSKPPHRFRIELRPDRDRVVVAPSGELDLGTAPALAGAIDGLVERGFDAIVIDLRATTFIDSTGLCLLLRQAVRREVRITVVDGPEVVSRVFDLAAVRGVLPFEVSQHPSADLRA